MSSSTFESLRTTLKNLRRRRRNLFILKHGSLFAIAAALLVLLISAISIWMDLDKAGTTFLFILALAGFGALFWRLVVTKQETLG